MSWQIKAAVALFLVSMVSGSVAYMKWATGKIAEQEVILEQRDNAIRAWQGSYEAATTHMNERDRILKANRTATRKVQADNTALRRRLHDALENNECAATPIPDGYANLLFPVQAVPGTASPEGVQEGVGIAPGADRPP